MQSSLIDSEKSLKLLTFFENPDRLPTRKACPLKARLLTLQPCREYLPLV